MLTELGGFDHGNTSILFLGSMARTDANLNTTTSPSKIISAVVNDTNDEHLAKEGDDELWLVTTW